MATVQYYKSALITITFNYKASRPKYLQKTKSIIIINSERIAASIH